MGEESKKSDVGRNPDLQVRRTGVITNELLKLMVEKQITHIDIKTVYAELAERLNLSLKERERQYLEPRESPNGKIHFVKVGYFKNEVRTVHETLRRSGVLKDSHIRSIWELTDSPTDDKWLLAKNYLKNHPYKPNFRRIVFQSFMTNLSKNKNGISLPDLKENIKIEIENSGFQFTQTSFNQTFANVKTEMTRDGIIKAVNGLRKDAVVELGKKYREDYYFDKKSRD